ncbi:uncharacterized protein [Anabrus simplex]|uniref:uncharacterized protein n=1 Tax=Anabrus simplex TaxID=316456 RepID=UPI0035A398E2
MCSCVYLLAFSAIGISYVSALTTKLAGPYDLAFRRMEHCKDEGTKELGYHTKLNKVSKYEFAYNGDFKMPDTTGISIAATVFKKMQSGQWFKIYDYFVADACEDVKKYLPDIFKKYTEEYLKVKPECPIAGGTYNADNWIVFFKDTPVEELEYGEYRVVDVFQRGEERIGCVELYVGVEEKAAN